MPKFDMFSFLLLNYVLRTRVACLGAPVVHNFSVLLTKTSIRPTLAILIAGVPVLAVS